MNGPRVMLGAIAGAFGVKGEVRLKSFCADPEAIAGYGPLWTDDGKHSYTVTLTGRAPGSLTARLSGIAERNAAEALRGVTLHVDRARLPAPPEDEFYHSDLIGLAVFDTGGAQTGKVTAVNNHGAGDFLEIDTAMGSVLLAFTKANVPLVDLTTGRIITDPPAEVTVKDSPDEDTGVGP